MEPLELTSAQLFEMEKFNRIIDTTSDLPGLKKITKQLLQAWMTQRAATSWIMRQNITTASKFNG